MLMPLVFCWDQNGQYARGKLSRYVLHSFSVRSTGIDRLLTLEICSEDTIIYALLAPPVLPIAVVIFHAPKELSKQRVTIASINFAVNTHLCCFESVEGDLNSIVIIAVAFRCS